LGGGGGATVRVAGGRGGTALMDRVGAAGAGRAVVGLSGGRAAWEGSVLGLVLARDPRSDNAWTVCEGLPAATTVAFGAGDLAAPSNVTVAVAPAVTNTAAVADTLRMVDAVVCI
jgi:hypothetical protein